MISKKRVVPNNSLRYERERRGWSQEYMAELVGAPFAYYVSRWERGVTTPSLHYRAKLCEIFGKDWHELDLLQKPAAPEVPDRLTPEVVYDPAIPLRLSNAVSLIGRDQLLGKLQQDLCKEEDTRTSAVYGLPGVGKTALAVAIASQAREHFRDGILWGCLGPQANLPALMSRWGTILGISETERSRFHDWQSWAHPLRFAIRERRMLLVLDDVWELEDALTCMIGGPHCAYLLTTRKPEIALHFAHADAMQVPELSQKEGIRLLVELAPALKDVKQEILGRLVDTVGGLPLALTLMGNYLLIQTRTSQPRRTQEALMRLEQVEVRLQLQQPHVDFAQASHTSLRTSLTLPMVIGISEAALDQTSQQALRALAHLPAKPNTFSEEGALAIAAVETNALDHLVDSGLLELTDQGRYQIHQTIVDYMRSKPVDDTVQERIITFYITYLQIHAKDSIALEQEITNELLALELAFASRHLRELLQGVNACAAFLISRGQLVTAAHLLERGREAALVLDDQTALAYIWWHLGRLAQQQSCYPQAEQHYLAGLALARRLKLQDLMCSLLAFLGEVTFFGGDCSRAETYLQEGLTLARQEPRSAVLAFLLKNLGEVISSSRDFQQGIICYQEGLECARSLQDLEMASALLQDLGVMAYRSSRYEQAEAYYCEGLALAQEIQHWHRMSALSMNLGVLAMAQADAPRAMRFYQQSLELARRVGSPLRICMVLENLGVAQMQKDHDDLAEKYFQESLTIAREIGFRWLISETLCEYGNLYFKRGQIQEAEVAFAEAEAIAQSMGVPELVAMIFYGQARVLAAQGYIAEARVKAQESLQYYISINSKQADTIRHLLATRIDATLP